MATVFGLILLVGGVAMVAVSLFGGDATVHELGDSSADPRSNLLVGGVGGVMLGLWLSGVFNPLLFVLNLLDKL